MRESPVFRNAIMAALQVFVSGSVLFALFYYLLRTIGPVQMGVWSVVLAATSAARLSELGLSGGVVKFVAQYLARSEEPNAATVVETAALSIAGFIGIILLPAFFFLRWLLGYVLPSSSLSDGLLLLPYALVSFWLNSVGSIFLATLDGVRRTDLRSAIAMTGTGLHLAFVFVLVPRNGLIGLAYAQVLQTSMILLAAWLQVRRFLPSLPVIPFHWDKELFREMFSYGVDFQFATFVRMLLDPLTKALLSRLAGLEVVSYYEMANRMVLQCRSLLVSANQVVVAVIAGMHESAPEKIRSVYKQSYRLLLFLALPLYASIGALIPVISELWVGRYEASFAAFSAILSVAWFFSTMSGPAYFTNLGTGHLRWNTLSHAAIGAVNVVAGVTLGHLFGAIGVVTGLAIALTAGSVIVVSAHHIKNKIRLSQLLPRENLYLAMASLFSIVIVRLVFHFASGLISKLSVAIISLTVLGAAMLPFMWLHPMRMKVVNWVFRDENSGRLSMR